MITSGFTKRSISDQVDVFSYVFDFSCDSLSGSCDFGFSGDNNFAFHFNSGKIYDVKNRFVGGYAQNERVLISGQIGQSSFDYFINNTPIAIGESFPSGRYSWCYIYPHNTTVTSHVSVDGKLPQYTYDTEGSYPYSGAIIDAHIVNQNPNVKFRIFDIDFQTINSSFRLMDFTTGDIQNTGHFRLTSSKAAENSTVIPLTFHTNFGDFNVPFEINGFIPLSNAIYLDVSPEDSSILNDVARTYTVYLSNYPNSADIGLSLSYLSGITGDIFYNQDITNSVSSLVSGQITGNGVLSTFVASTLTGLDPLRNIIVTGEGSGYLYTNTVYPTGFVSGDFQVLISGKGDGQFKGNYLAEAGVTDIFSGLVGLSGGLSFPRVFEHVYGTGSNPIVYSDYIPSATGRAYLYPTGAFSLDAPLDSGSYISGTLLVPKNFEGWVSGDFHTLGIGYAIGGYRTGQVRANFLWDFEPGYYAFRKPFDGMVSGTMLPFYAFAPESGCNQPDIGVSGEISGIFTWPPHASRWTGFNSTILRQETGYLDCSDFFPAIIPTGFPKSGLLSNLKPIDPLRIVFFHPNEGTSRVHNETTEAYLSGIPIRTRSSRMGITPSGIGQFENVVSSCIVTPLTGEAAKFKYASPFQGYWGETLPKLSGLFEATPLDTHIVRLQSEFELSNQNRNVSLETNTNGSDGTIAFHISGTKNKQMVFRTSGAPDQNTSLQLFKQNPHSLPATGYVKLLASAQPYGTNIGDATSATVTIGSNLYKYHPFQSGVFTPPYSFADMVVLKNIINSGLRQEQVTAEYIGDNTITLQAIAPGVAGNSIALNAGYGFNVPPGITLAGGRESGSYWDLIVSNKGWKGADPLSQEILSNNNLAPSGDLLAGFGMELAPGDYRLKVYSDTVVIDTHSTGGANSRGYLELASSAFSGCESWNAVPITIFRQNGTLGEITGTLTFDSFGHNRATPFVDYDATPITFRFANGENAIQVPVLLVDDGDVEVMETFHVLMNAYYADSSISAVGGTSNGVVYIYDDDIGTNTAFCANQTTPCYPNDPRLQANPAFNCRQAIPIVSGIDSSAELSCRGLGHIVLLSKVVNSTNIRESPLNVEDNASTSARRKFVAFEYQDFNNETWKLEYTRREAFLPNGYVIDSITITEPDRPPIVFPNGKNNSISFSLGNMISGSANVYDGYECVAALNPSGPPTPVFTDCHTQTVPTTALQYHFSYDGTAPNCSGPTVDPVQTFTNPYNTSAHVAVYFDADDDCLINGHVWNPNKFVFHDGVCPDANGAHSDCYSAIMASGESITVGVRSNFRGTIGLDGDIYFWKADPSEIKPSVNIPAFSFSCEGDIVVSTEPFPHASGYYDPFVVGSASFIPLSGATTTSNLYQSDPAGLASPDEIVSSATLVVRQLHDRYMLDFSQTYDVVPPSHSTITASTHMEFLRSDDAFSVGWQAENASIYAVSPSGMLIADACTSAMPPTFGGFPYQIEFSVSNTPPSADNTPTIQTNNYQFVNIDIAPTMNWFNTQQIGGGLYYILKKAADRAIGTTFNHVAGLNVDGISQVLSPERTRASFDSSLIAVNGDLQTIEPTSRTTINKIFLQWNSLAKLKGLWDGSFDPILNPCYGVFQASEPVISAVLIDSSSSSVTHQPTTASQIISDLVGAKV